ncbi:MAG: PAS domain S-box protein [Gaiellaceae bacterium]
MTAPAPATGRPPRLVLRFAIYSALALLAAGLGIFWVVRAETQARAEREMVARAERFSERIGSEIRPSDLRSPVSDQRARALDRAFAYEFSHDLVLVKLWTREGILVYSNDHALRGVRSGEPDDIEEAISGRTLREVTNLDEEGGRQDLKTIEALVPVSRGGNPVAAVEVNFDYRPVARDVRTTMTPVGIALGLALLLLYATLLPILRQVTRALEARSRQLAEDAEALGRALQEREDAERRLSAAEQGYRSLIEQLPLVTYIDRLDETSSSIYISPQVEDLLGYPPVAWLSDREFFPNVLHPDDRERVLAQTAEAYASGESFASEYRLLAEDGRVVWVQDHVMIARDGTGRPQHAQGFLLDVTERKRAEEELRLHNRELAALHETAIGLIDRLDVGDVLDAILARACELVDSEHGYLYLVDGDELSARLGRGAFEEKVGYRLARGHALAGRVWETGEPLAVEDYESWSGRSSDFDETGFRSVVGVPIRSGADIAGVLGVARVAGGAPFTKAEIGLLGRIGHLAALAIENARMHGALAESEEKFRTLVGNVPGAIFRAHHDDEWTMLYVSDAVEEISGYRADDLIENRGLSFASIVHPDDRAGEEAIAEALAKGQPYSVEYRILHADGSPRWVLERGKAAGEADGKAIVEGAIFDITEQKRAEEQRRQLAAIVEHSDDAIMSGSTDGRLTSWNAGAEKMFGYTADEVLGRRAATLTPPDRKGEADERIREVIATGSVVHAETVRLRKDGSLIDVAYTYSPIRDASGKIVGISAIAQDIGARKQAQEALAVSEAKFRAFVETTEEWVWEADEHGVMLYSNPAGERILGYATDELVGRDSLELVHPEDRERIAAELPGLVARKEGWSGLVIRWQHKDGSHRHLESNATPILDAAGELRGWRGADRDVTERILAEAEREAARRELTTQNERLRELDKLKDEFIALVSHELRTPLTSIRGYTELLLDGEGGDLTEEQRRFLGVVERNSHRLLHLVGDLLFLAQIEAGKLVLDADSLDLAALTSDSVEAARPAAEEKGVTLTLATGPAPPLVADQARIAQLLDNLVSNAVKFTPSGGRVDVRVRELEARAVIEVRDSGIGIPAGERQFLFQRFYRTSTATEQAIQGTGLGLAISKAIVEAHGGEIDVESEEGAGTTFRVSLPFEQHASKLEPAAIAL